MIELFMTLCNEPADCRNIKINEMPIDTACVYYLQELYSDENLKYLKQNNIRFHCTRALETKP